MIVVDTNVLSELTKPKPSPEVVAWFDQQRIPDLFTTAITLAEIQMGIHLMPKGRRRDVLQRGADTTFDVRFAGRVLPFDSDAARAFCEIVGRRRRLGRPIEIMDAQIAAIALSHRAVIATRDASDFANCGVHVVNPWRTLQSNQ
jgi:predicted nucleic acid-binding protein